MQPHCPVYARRLAETVVKNLEKSLGRGTNLIADYLGTPRDIYRETLIHTFMYDNARFQRLRDTMKKVYKYHLLPKDGTTTILSKVDYLISVGPLRKKDIVMSK